MMVMSQREVRVGFIYLTAMLCPPSQGYFALSTTSRAGRGQ